MRELSKLLLIGNSLETMKKLNNKIIRIAMREDNQKKIRKINYCTNNNYYGRLINNKKNYNLRMRGGKK